MNVGAGPGSYEPPGRVAAAVEPSVEMIGHRPRGAAPVLRAVAEHLPFPGGSFDAAMALLTVHHWIDPVAGLAEVRRVTDGPVVVFTFDKAMFDESWLTEYLPAAQELDAGHLESSEIAQALGGGRVEIVPVPHDCVDGFGHAYWRRPAAYLDPVVRAGISTFARLPDDVVIPAMDRLRDDIDSGSWARQHAGLLRLEELDAGFGWSSPSSGHADDDRPPFRAVARGSAVGPATMEGVSETWGDERKVEEYLDRVGRIDARRAGEAELVEALPAVVDRALDLGCGDGGLMALVLDARPDLRTVIGIDNSEPMLERARTRFRDEPRAQLAEHDLAEALPDLAPVDAVVSGFAIHHLSHERKRELFVEVARLLRPGGVFANLEVVQCATPELHKEFNRRIGRPGGDPEDVLASPDEQLRWLRDAGLEQVDCNWRWRGFVLLVGQRPHARHEP